MTKFFGIQELTVNSGVSMHDFTINLMGSQFISTIFFSCFLLKLPITFNITGLNKKSLNCFCEWAGLNFSVFYMREPMGKKNNPYKTKNMRLSGRYVGEIFVEISREIRLKMADWVFRPPFKTDCVYYPFKRQIV